MNQLTRVLLVEDDDLDAALLEDELRKLPTSVHVHRVRDGDECMRYLRSDVPRPDAIFLDLKMPIKDGREVLGELRVDPDLSIIPVIVVSASDADSERSNAYRLGCNSYVRKPPGDRAKYETAMAEATGYWVLRNLPPPR